MCSRITRQEHIQYQSKRLFQSASNHLEKMEDIEVLMSLLKTLIKIRLGSFKKTSRITGISTSSLYTMFNRGNPKLQHLIKVLDAAGYKLVVEEK